jgi:hypothetical protein
MVPMPQNQRLTESLPDRIDNLVTYEKVRTMQITGESSGGSANTLQQVTSSECTDFIQADYGVSEEAA